MKILVLPAYYYPEQAASPYLGDNIREAMCNAGFILDLYAPMPTRGVSEEIRVEYKERKIEYKLVIHRFPMYSEGKNPINRALRYGICWCVQFGKGLCAKDIDLIYLASTPPIQGALGCLLKKIKRVPFVYNLQDIFPDSLAGTGLVRKDGLIWRIGRVVYNWVDQNAVKNVARKDNKLFDKYHLDRNKFYITYSGNIGLTQNMDLLLDVARSLEDNEEIQFVLIGEGAYKEQVKEVITRNNIKNVTLLPFQPYEDISHVFSLGDVGIIISKPGVGENSVPSKTWSIMSASRPVLANFDENEIKTILSENECGVFTKAGDKQAFTDAILELCRNREMCRKYGENGRKFVMENLTREIGTQKYIDVIKSVAKG